MFLIKTAGTVNNSNLPFLVRDKLLENDNGGVKALFDLGFGYSWPGGDPDNGDTIVDVSGHGNMTFVEDAQQSIPHVGGGFDFGAIDTTNEIDKFNHILMPGDVWSTIQAEQHFLVAIYMRLPAEVDWVQDPVGSQFAFFSSSDSSIGYQTEPDPVTIGLQRFGRLQAFRQSDINAGETRQVEAAGHFGEVAQVAFWRDANGQGFRIRSEAGGTTLATFGALANNTADFSSAQPKIGVATPFSTYAASTTAMKYRIYRGFIENLAESGRDSAVVLDADYARVMARGAFS